MRGAISGGASRVSRASTPSCPSKPPATSAVRDSWPTRLTPDFEEQAPQHRSPLRPGDRRALCAKAGGVRLGARGGRTQLDFRRRLSNRLWSRTVNGGRPFGASTLSGARVLACSVGANYTPSAPSVGRDRPVPGVQGRIGFRSLTEALDTATPQGRLVFHLFGALAKIERGLIRERTSAGLAAAKRLGRTGGRPAKRTDEDLDVATTLLANPDITSAEVAERVGVSPATLYRYLRAARTTHGPDIKPVE